MVVIAPTLARMAEIHVLPRAGGANSERFRRYLAHVEHEWGLAAYNPMAGAAASVAIDRLLELGAEVLAQNVATDVLQFCQSTESIKLAVVLRSPGMWTDRLATEAEYCAAALERPLHGLVNLWSTDKIDHEQIRKESAAETARVIWTAMHGTRGTVRAILRREGLAYAIASRVTAVADRYGTTLPSKDREAVTAAVDLLGESSESSDKIGVLFGDEVAAEMGWTPLGLPHYAGYRCAIAEAASEIGTVGVEQALRTV